MSQRESLLSSALRHADVPVSDVASEFWTERIEDLATVRDVYARYNDAVPLNKDVVFYETMSGDRMNDNPFAIFEYLRSHPEYGNFLHVWSLSERGTIPERYAGLDDVVFVRRNSIGFAYFLASAGHVICNAGLPNYFSRRNGQKYLNTWHGIPYKTVGRGSARAAFGIGLSSTFLQASHIVTPCKFMTDVLLSSYSMIGSATAQLAETGYPRVDATVNVDNSRVLELRRSLGLDEAGAETPVRPVVLYAPTWREVTDMDSVNSGQLTRDLEALATLDIQLMYRGHHKVGRRVEDNTVGDQLDTVIVPPHEISSNELLTAVDILITDYSSIFFDFLPTGRPIVHYLYDLDEYEKRRGVNLRLDELPGDVARTRDELVEVVERSATALSVVTPGTDPAVSPLQGAAYKAAQLRFAPHEDGSSSARAVDFLFRGETAGLPVRTARDGRPTIVFWAGALDEGPESTAFMRELKEFSTSPLYQVTLVVGRERRLNKQVRKAIRALRHDIAAIAYDVVEPTVFPVESSAYVDFTNKDLTAFTEVRNELRNNPSLKAVFAREYRRCLGESHFDTVILAPGLTQHQLALAFFASPTEGSLGVKPQRPRKHGRSVRGAVGKLLPKGSALRTSAEKLYLSLRRPR